jgi:outer membrane lipoprotein-sorting protein
MKLLFVPVLAAALTQAGDDPEKLFRAMEAKVAAADTLRVTFATKMEAPGTTISFQGTLVVAAGNKIRLEADVVRMDKTSKIIVVCDGTKRVTSDNGKDAPPKDAPPHLRALMTVALARMGVSAAEFLGSVGPADKQANPLDTFKASTFEKVKTEKIGDRTALVIDYQLSGAGKSVVACAVWIDTATQLPLKRILRAGQGADSVTFTETYSAFAINPKLDPKLFELPK